MNETYQHQYRIGDAVLADFNAARVPGVIEAEREGQLLVRLAEPWADETGQQSDEMWLSPEQLEPYVGDDIAGGATGWFTGDEVFPGHPA